MGRRPAISHARLGELHQELFIPLVRRATWRHGVSKEDARDVVQQAFVVAVEKLNDDVNAVAWLYRTVDFLSVNHQRTIFRRVRLAAKWIGFDRVAQIGNDWEASDGRDTERDD